MAGRFVSLLSFKKVRANKWKGFIDHTTGYQFNKGYKSFYELEQHVKDFRLDNKLSPVSPPFVTLSDELQAFFCANPSFSRECCQNERYASKMPFYQKVYKGASALIQTAMGDKWVPQEQAEKRAALCVGCPFNNIEEKFIITDELMKRVVETMTVPIGTKLGVCGVCSCPLGPKVWFPAQICYQKLSKNEKAKMRQGFIHRLTNKHAVCWQVAEIEGEKKDG